MQMLFELILEAILGTAIEGVLDAWTRFMKKRNPDYENNRFRKGITIVAGLLMSVLILALFLAVLFFIEWLDPDLFDLVGFD